LNPIKFQYYVHYGTQSTISTIDFDRPNARVWAAERTGGTSNERRADWRHFQGRIRLLQR
jgi:hypothetical protein